MAWAWKRAGLDYVCGAGSGTYCGSWGVVSWAQDGLSSLLSLQIPQTLQNCQPSWMWARDTWLCSSALWTVAPWPSWPCSMRSDSWPPAWGPSSHPMAVFGPKPWPTLCS